MKNKGFTLLELLTVIAIISVLTAVAIPVFSGSRERAEAAVCASNRRALLSQLSYRQIEQNRSAEDAFAELSTEYSLSSATRSEYTCPADGVFTLKNGIINCSVHGGGDEEGANAVDIGGMKVVLSDNVLTEPKRVGNDILKVSKGEIFHINDVFYMALDNRTNLGEDGFDDLINDPYHYVIKPVNFDNVVTAEDLGGGEKMLNTSNFRSLMKPGSIYIYENKVYVQATIKTFSKESFTDPTKSPGVWTYFGEIA